MASFGFTDVSLATGADDEPVRVRHSINRHRRVVNAQAYVADKQR